MTRPITTSLLLACLTAGLYAGAALAQSSFDARRSRVSQALQNGEFDVAEDLLESLLLESPEDLSLLAQMDMALNGQERFETAAGVRELILEIWRRDHRDDWIARGSPVEESSWARIVAFTDGYMVAATEYYEPEIHDGPGQLTYYYKFIVFGEVEGFSDRLYKLESSQLVDTSYFLGELTDSGHRNVRGYGVERPDIRVVLADVLRDLETTR